MGGPPFGSAVSLSSMYQGQELTLRICEAVSALPVDILVTTGRGIAPNAEPAEIRSAITGMLSDEALRRTSRTFASGVPRFGDLVRAADLIKQGVRR